MHEDIKQAWHIVFMVLLLAAGVACFFGAMSLLPEKPIHPDDKRFKELEARVEAIEATITKGHDRALEVGVIDDKRPSEHFFEEDE